jgi:hypothetical protein
MASSAWWILQLKTLLLWVVPGVGSQVQAPLVLEMQTGLALAALPEVQKWVMTVLLLA